MIIFYDINNEALEIKEHKINIFPKKILSVI